VTNRVVRNQDKADACFAFAVHCSLPRSSTALQWGDVDEDGWDLLVFENILLKMESLMETSMILGYRSLPRSSVHDRCHISDTHSVKHIRVRVIFDSLIQNMICEVQAQKLSPLVEAFPRSFRLTTCWLGTDSRVFYLLVTSFIFLPCMCIQRQGHSWGLDAVSRPGNCVLVLERQVKRQVSVADIFSHFDYSK
jgi:hypothetical protein